MYDITNNLPRMLLKLTQCHLKSISGMPWNIISTDNENPSYVHLGFNRQECLHPSYLLKVGDAKITTIIPHVVPNYGHLKSACQNRPEWVWYCQHWPNTCPISYWHVYRMHNYYRTCNGLSWQNASTDHNRVRIQPMQSAVNNACDPWFTTQHWVNSNPVVVH